MTVTAFKNHVGYIFNIRTDGHSVAQGPMNFPAYYILAIACAGMAPSALVHI